MIIALISDLHLEENTPQPAEIFKKFLIECTTRAKALYILGDFFESWVGDDDLTPFNRSIIDALKTATQNGLPIYFTHGNRDFMIGKKFLAMTGCKLLPDEYTANIFGTRVLLMHGDTLCTADIKYLTFRKKSRTWWFKFFMQLYPLKKRRAIAAGYREASKAHTSQTPAYIMDVTQSEVVRVMQRHGVLHMIHGHTHRPAVHTFELNGQHATRTVLAAWHEKGHALMCYEDGRQEAVDLD